MLLFYYFNFERNYDVLKSKSPYICWTKIQTLSKTKREQKWKIPHAVLERQTLCFSSYENRELKVKLWCAGAQKRKKSAFFVATIYYVQKIFFKYLCFISMYNVLNTLSKYTCFYISKKLCYIRFFACFQNRPKLSVYS